MGTSLDVRASTSTSFRVNCSRKRETIDFLVSTSFLEYLSEGKPKARMNRPFFPQVSSTLEEGLASFIR